jgi:triacylglycerol lipase
MTDGCPMAERGSMKKPVARSLHLAALAALVSLCAACGSAAIPDPSDVEVSSSDAALTARPPAATVVLVHGMGGFRNIGPVGYFFQVPALWQQQGAKVYVAAEASFASIEDRAAQLKAQLDRIQGPLVLVAHSQGGLDARWLITKLGYANRVRALITIATPHRGSPVADVWTGVTKGPIEDVINILIGTFGWSLAGAEELTTGYMTNKFNPAVPDASNVIYWSYAGKATPLGIGSNAGWLHSVLLPTWTLMQAEHRDSDGIVPVDSARWGVFKGYIPGDHLGEVNQPLGETPGFHALSFYSGLLQAMHDQGW